MSSLWCSCSSTRPTKPFPTLSHSSNTTNFPQKLLFNALNGTLSMTLLLSPPSPSIASLVVSSPISSPASTTEYCTEEEVSKVVDKIPREVVKESDGYASLVEEVWQIVNDGFLDYSDRHRWSSEAWMQKKEDIIGSSIQSRSKAHEIIRRMLATLGDPYTRFLSPYEFSKMARYDMTGIGINLREVPDEDGGMKLKVLGLILDGPAHKAGVKQGDEILSVNGMDVSGKSSFEVSSLLQGPSETFVTVEVKHGRCGSTRSIDVQRQLVARTPVFYRLEQTENGTSAGYIRLKEFNALARRDLAIAMKRLQDSGASYFILDLRDNLGGLVQAGIEIAKLFLGEGETVIYTVGRDPVYGKTIVAETAPLVTTPVIVMVNNKTASASEIVASALHDNCRAVLVGERTFGKGLIQSVFELRDGSGVVVTVGKYVTPNHVDINGNGIEPDYQRAPALDEVKEHLMQCHKSSG